MAVGKNKRLSKGKKGKGKKMYAASPHSAALLSSAPWCLGGREGRDTMGRPHEEEGWAAEGWQRQRGEGKIRLHYRMADADSGGSRGRGGGGGSQPRREQSGEPSSDAGRRLDALDAAIMRQGRPAAHASPLVEPAHGGGGRRHEVVWWPRARPCGSRAASGAVPPTRALSLSLSACLRNRSLSLSLSLLTSLLLSPPSLSQRGSLHQEGVV
jgi:hypothetical protein